MPLLGGLLESLAPVIAVVLFVKAFTDTCTKDDFVQHGRCSCNDCLIALAARVVEHEGREANRH